MVSIFLLAIPLLLLYGLSIGVSYMFRSEIPPGEPATAEPPATL
jgi:Sec-independent protein secretion pathway component TatC